MDLPTQLARLRHLALDLDGTIFKDRALIDGALPFLRLLDELGMGRTFVTNKSSRSTQDYVAFLRHLGIDADDTDIYSSTHSTIEYLKEELPRARSLFVLGTPGLQGEFASHGYAIAGETPGDAPDAVVVGFDSTLTYERLCRAAYWIGQGKTFLATHLDRVCPTDEETILVDCGSICAALTHATGRAPDRVLGKPDRRLLEGLMSRHGLNTEQLAMVGDRLYTDIAMANAAGILSILVLTGEATAAEADASADPPGLTINDLVELGRLLRESRGAHP